ncbi:MAG: chromosome partitioning protein ParB, partial [Planctomycetes bacterium]|nr:chromosome partitioning protein ParB [Planctomycetota bacterium]
MNIVDLPLRLLVEASWNPNSMDAAMLGRLTKSIDSYGLVSPFVVRQMG